MRGSIGVAYEQWDGRGWPGPLKAGAVPVAPTIAQLAEFIELARRVGGIQAAAALAGRRAGKQFDPALAALLCAHAAQILGELEAVPAWQERVPMSSYLTERMVHQSAALAPLGEIAVQHRERPDGSGTPGGFPAARSPGRPGSWEPADADQSVREPRPHRRVRSAQEAAAEMRSEVRAGRPRGRSGATASGACARNRRPRT